MLPYIEAGLGLKRKHLIAISLLVGNDHDLNGVQGVGLEKARCFV
jgi:flap endonuclease GEN